MQRVQRPPMEYATHRGCLVQVRHERMPNGSVHEQITLSVPLVWPPGVRRHRSGAA